jgi:hypothetical protein
MSITFSSCFYIIKSKFEPEKYIEWMNNFISIVNNFYLVIYTDETSLKFINSRENPNIKIIIKPIEIFYSYKYKDFWIENHNKNVFLNDKSCWELNMLWSEKINFVKETIEKNYFDTEYYGWCDVGYFRNRTGSYTDSSTNELLRWPDNNKISQIDKNKIVYACINNNYIYLNDLIKIICDKNIDGLPKKQIPPAQNSIAGGFFILHKTMIDWWFHTYYGQLENYFKHNYLVKDDQIIVADCVFSNLNKFSIFRECQYPYDNWFMFQRILN